MLNHCGKGRSAGADSKVTHENCEEDLNKAQRGREGGEQVELVGFESNYYFLHVAKESKQKLSEVNSKRKRAAEGRRRESRSNKEKEGETAVKKSGPQD